MDKPIQLFLNADPAAVLPLGKDWTCIGFILDQSGSMEAMENEARSGYNAFVEEQGVGPDRAALTTVLFNHELYLLSAFADIRTAVRLNKGNYRPDGMTALLDAMGHTIDSIGGALDRLQERNKPNRVIIVTLTDGIENASKQFSLASGGRAAIQQKIRHQREVYSWEFLFLGAGFDAVGVAQDYGIPATHAATMHAGAQGMNVGINSVNDAMTSYRCSAPGDQHYVQHLAANQAWGGISSKPKDDEDE